MMIIMRKEEIEKRYQSIRKYCLLSKIPQMFISRWNNKKRRTSKCLENSFIKKLSQDGFIDTFRLIGVLTFNKDVEMHYYPKIPNNNDSFLYFNGSPYPYELLYCDFVVNCIDGAPPAIKNIIEFLDKYKIKVISKEDYYKELQRRSRE